MLGASAHLERLCAGPDRRPGSQANHAATRYVRSTLESLGWQVSAQWFDCLDWDSAGGTLDVEQQRVPIVPSLYGRGGSGSGPLVPVADLDQVAASPPGSVLMLHGDLAARPLTPRGYPFYSSEEDERLLDLLEAVRPVAIVSVTGRYPQMCGALDPFPLIEDGTFGVPVADVGPELGDTLLALAGRRVEVEIRATRRPARAANVLARRGTQDRRVTVVAHVDSKPGTPGALDNASGVTAVLLAAEALAAEPFDGPVGIEWLLVNGEDYYAASGEQAYLRGADLSQVVLAVNLDGVGLPHSPTAWSSYGWDDALHARLRSTLATVPGLVEGPAWFQSDHAVFAMAGRPALALTSADMDAALGSVAHAPTDTPDRLDLGAVHQAAAAVEAVVRVVAL